MIFLYAFENFDYSFSNHDDEKMFLLKHTLNYTCCWSLKILKRNNSSPWYLQRWFWSEHVLGSMNELDEFISNTSF